MNLTAHMRVLRPHPQIRAFYDGRVEGHRFAPGPNWVDEGALSLGIASYAILSGDAAVIYDTHVSLDHAAFIRRALEAEGVRRFTVVLSHGHLDHVAGTGVFAGSDIIANARTHAHLLRERADIEAGTRPPAIRPLHLPTRTFDGTMRLRLGDLDLQLITLNVHSDDATVIWWPQARILLAGDTVEDSVTYVGAPEDFAQHLADLDRMAALGAAHILPNHGAAEVIAAGGYGAGLIPATQGYIRWLMSLPTRPEQAAEPLAQVIAADLARGDLTWFAPYQAVHAQNVARTLAQLGRGGGDGLPRA